MKKNIIDPIANQPLPDYEDIVSHFNEKQCWGLLLSIDAKNCNAEAIRSQSKIEDYVIKLCDLIEVKRFNDPIIVHFGEDKRVAGYSLVQLIETSLVSGHFANEYNIAYIDIFSCKLYNPHIAAQFTAQHFESTDVNTTICFRYKD